MSDQDIQESADTLADSSVGEQTPGLEADSTDAMEDSSSPESTEEVSESEAAWNSMSGKSQSRFAEQIALRKQAEAEAEQLKAQLAQQDAQRVNQMYPNVGGNPQPTDEVKQAIDTLRSQNVFATQDDLQLMLGRIELNREHETLEGKFNGDDGLPAYDRREVEDYAQRKGFRDMQAAYRDMYFDEFVDASKKQTRRRGVTTEKPRASQRKAPKTANDLRRELTGPDAVKNYEKYASDPDKMDAMIQALTEDAST